MAFRDIQRDEVVKLIFQLRPRRDGKTHPTEKFGQLIDDFHQDMTIADLPGGCPAR